MLSHIVVNLCRKLAITDKQRQKNAVGHVKRTPAQQVVPHQVLLLSKHSHHNESVKVDPLTQHPEVHTAQNIEMDERGHLTAHLEEKTGEIGRAHV